MSKFSLTSLLPLLLTFLLSGCSSLDLSEDWQWSISDDKPQIPTEIVDVWTNDILHRSGEASKRGFGGRLMFYNEENETPIKVEGALTVYLFDDHGEDPMREEPVHKFIFPAETLDKHYSESKLGHSYSFWLPVDEVGGVEKRLTIIARFEPTTGGRLLAKPSTHVLPGKPVDEQLASPLVQRFEASKFLRKADGQVQQVAHFEMAPSQPEIEKPQERGITTTTINLPPGFTRQIGNAPQQSAFGAPMTLPGAPASGTVPVSAVPAQSSSVNVPSAAQVPAVQPGQASVVTSSANSILASQQPTRFELPRFPARREALGRPVSSRVRTQPFHATWPSALPRTPRAASTNESMATPTNAPSSTSPWPEQEVW